MENKQKLLDSPMNKLGLGGAFNNYFWSKDVQQSDVITLTEFISLNPFLKASKEIFICWRTPEIKRSIRHRTFIKESRSFQKLKNFLLKNKFTHEDWVLLLPNALTAKGLLPNLALLSKQSLLNLPYQHVTETKLSCRPAELIRYYFERSSEQPILVKDIINLTDDNLQSSFFPPYKKTMEKTFVNIQKRFKRYNLTKEDGPFMKIDFSSKKSKDYYLNDLIHNKGFSKKEAITAINLGIKAGWIFF